MKEPMLESKQCVKMLALTRYTCTDAGAFNTSRENGDERRPNINTCLNENRGVFKVL